MRLIANEVNGSNRSAGSNPVLSALTLLSVFRGEVSFFVLLQRSGKGCVEQVEIGGVLRRQGCLVG